MKFMPQDIFEVCALNLAKYKILDPLNYSKIKIEVFQLYANDFKGDNLWLQQCDELTSPLFDLCSTCGAKNVTHMLAVAQEVRQKFDENMEIVSGVKSIFHGTMFTKNHPSPISREEIAMKNIQLLFVKMIGSGFVPK
jgi:hypothetical protein